MVWGGDGRKILRGFWEVFGVILEGFWEVLGLFQVFERCFSFLDGFLDEKDQPKGQALFTKLKKVWDDS